MAARRAKSPRPRAASPGPSRSMPEAPPAGFFGRHTNQYVYLPNLIGYARVLCAGAALLAAFDDPRVCLAAYLFAFVCDELDGRVARLCEQTSTLGAVLDMVTDRLSTTGLLMVLGALNHRLFPAAAALVVLDIASHWFQMYVSLLRSRSSHKDVAPGAFWLLRMYYRHRLVMGYCCVSAEVLYLAIYLLHFPDWAAPGVPLPTAWTGRDAAPARWLTAGGLLRPAAGPGGAALLSWAGLLALLAVPGWLLKQVANVAQLKAAMDGCVEHDLQAWTAAAKDRRRGR